MKKLFIVVLALALPALCFAGKGGKPGGAKKETGKMHVELRDVSVKSAPNYMASSVGKLLYGAEINVTGEDGGWYQIDSPSGWVPKSAVTKHKVALNPDQKMAGKNVSHDEVALAGKGFNPQVEAQYKRENKDLAAAYLIVDKVETIDVNDAELKQFANTGKLKAR